MVKSSKMDKRILEMILRNQLLIEAEEESAEDEQSSEEDTNELKSPFEKDPMGFILSKYHTLNEVLTELMTSSYREYINAIFIVAPKPTTFKILLHNGQFFFLTYLGKAYEATVQGKDYYLMTIGEKERCMQAIARMLRYGSPIQTKGPEGAEQGTRPEEGGGEGSAASTGGGEAGSGETPEAGGVEAGGGAGEEEPLKESLVLKTILKKSLFEEEDSEIDEPEVNAEPEVKKEPKKKSEPKTKKVSLIDLLKKGFEDKGFPGDKNSKRGTHLRYLIGTEKDVYNAINDILKSQDNSDYYKIDSIAPKDYSKGAKSGTYPTQKVTILKDTGDLKQGEEVFIVNQKKEDEVAVKAELFPKNLGLEGKLYKDHTALKSAIIASVNKLSDKQLSDILISLTNLVDTNVSDKFTSVKDIKNYQESIKFDDNTINQMSKLSNQDINSIGVSFGESLGALALLKSVKKPASGVKFSDKSNNALSDFEIDGYKVSSKYKKGAAAAISSIVKEVNEKNLTENQKKLYKILKLVVDNDTATGFIEIAKELESPAIEKISSITGISEDNITPKSLNDYFTKLFKDAKSDKEKSDLAIEKLTPYYALIKRWPKGKVINFDNFEKGPAQYFGMFIGPLSYNVADILNSKEIYTNSLAEILSKIEVKQLHMDLSMSDKTFNVKLKSFSDPNQKFEFNNGKGSVYQPTKGKLAFSLV